MNSIITGSNGFIGSHLLQRTLPNVSTIPHELIQKAKLKPFDFFFFCSAYGNLYNQTDEDQIYKANIEDLLSVLSQIKKFKFKSFVFLSSSSVMLKTQTTYSRCKRAAEEILLAFMERHDLPICIARPFSVTGIGDNPQHLIPTLIKAAYTGELVNFAPNPVHDWIDIFDVVDGILSLSQHGARGIYQIGTGKATSNLDVLHIVESVTQRKIKVNAVDSLRPYDNQTWFSSNFKARSYGWLPRKDLRQSITEMVSAYEN